MADDPSYLDRKRKTLRARLGHWTAEVVLVFVGVSAAFWLNNYQQHAQEAQHRDRILASLERTLREGIASGKVNAAREEQERAEFQRALDAGEMPLLRPYIFTTDYSPGHSPRSCSPAVCSCSMWKPSPPCVTTNRLSAGG